MAFTLDALPLPSGEALSRTHRNAGRGHLRLVVERRCTTPGRRANPRLGAAICLGFCGLFWSAVAVVAAVA